MNILQINTVYKTGSTGKIVKDLNDFIVQSGVKSYVAYGRGEHEESNCIKIGTALDMNLHALGTRIFDKHGLYSAQATREFIQKIDLLNIDIIHLHNIHGYYLNYPILFEYLKKKNMPVIWTLHDCWSFTGHCSHYEYVGCDKWESQCYECPQLRQYPASLVFDNSKNNFLLKKQCFQGLENLTIVTPSNWLANEVKKSFLAEYETIVVNNGIDLNIFQQRESSFREKNNLLNSFLILGVANIWEERKGLEYFIELAKNIKEDEKIILIGLNDRQLTELPSNIFGIKRTQNQKELAELYSTVDVFVNPTLEEVLGLTNIESLACGTPVVTFESGGSSECIDESCGIIVPKGNLNTLYDAIMKIQQNTKQFYENACVSRTQRLYAKEDMIRKYMNLYEGKS